MTTAERHGPTPPVDPTPDPTPDPTLPGADGDDGGGVRPVDATPVVVVLLLGTVAVLLADVLLLLLAPDRGSWAALRDAFDVNREANVPTAWNALLLAVVASVAAGAALLVRERRRGWTVGAVVAAVLALDEVAGAHERVRPLARQALERWAPDQLVPAVLVVVGVVGLALVWRWSGSVPRPGRPLLRAGLAVWAVGAVVLDEVLPQLPVRPEPGSTSYVLARALEEGLEMVGCVLVVAAVLSTLATVTAAAGHRAVVVVRRS